MALRFAPTVEDILGLPDDGYRHELVYGVHHVSSAPSGRHQISVARFLLRLMLTRPPEYEVLPAPFAWIATDPDGERHEIQPDLLVVTAEQAQRQVLEDELPFLVVEVLSPGAANRARALEEKFGLYQAVGVPAYWAFDPINAVLRAWRLRGRELELPSVAAGECFEADWPWPVSLSRKTWSEDPLQIGGLELGVGADQDGRRPCRGDHPGGH
ncbi:MAG: Uma2 family endonuclease [Acidimicrobiales bacterium]